VLLTVGALMVVMLATSVAPAFAAWETNGCRMGDTLFPAADIIGTDAAAKDKNGDGLVCIRFPTNSHQKHAKIYDNRLL
jgi:hypothetical protein